jgi:DNA polymerase-4
MDAFYAAVEVREDPSLAGRPLIIGHKGPRGVVSTCSYEARRFGVRSAMPSLTAMRLCPQATWLPGRMDLYVEVSRGIRRLFDDFTPLVEPLSIDEAFLDLTGVVATLEEGAGAARRLKDRVRAEERLTASVGVAPTKFLAKLASDLEKPDGLVVFPLEDVPGRLWPLPVEKLWGVGPRSAARLHRLGLRVVGDVVRAGEERLEETLGLATARHLVSLARGEDPREVVPERDSKSISEERTFAVDLRDPDAIETVLLERSEGVARALRREGLAARTVRIKVRTGTFKTWTRAATLPGPSALTEEIYRAARDLFRTRIRLGGQGVRLLGVGAGNLVPAGSGQIELFPDAAAERASRVARAADALSEKYGDEVVKRARLLRARKRKAGHKPRSVVFLAVLGALTLVSSARAAVPAADFANEWRPFGLKGAVVRSLAATPGRLYAGTEGRGVFTLDLLVPTGGWKALGPAGATITWIWIDRFEPNVLFAATGPVGGGATDVLLYRSLDGGLTWEPVDSNLRRQGATFIHAVDGVPTLPILAPLPIPFPVYAAGEGVWRSDDRGESWSRVFQFPFEFSVQVSPTDLLRTVWAGGETFILQGFTIVSRDGGARWEQVWDSSAMGDNQTSDIAAHPLLDGLALTGHEGFVLRTRDHGATFGEVLSAPARFFLDWDRAHPSIANAGGSPNGGGAHAFVSADFGQDWLDVTGTVLAPRTVFRMRADARRLGVVYAATDDGVYRRFGGGSPLCLDTRAGINALRLWPGLCPPILAPGPVVAGAAIAVDLEAIHATTGRIDLGEVECLIDGRDIAFSTIDTPDPAPGKALAILARPEGSPDYGASSEGLPRIPSLGDCP